MAQNKDDWRDETQRMLDARMLYRTLRDVASTDQASIQLLGLVNDATHYAYQRTKLIAQHMREYTLHDGDHLFRVLHLMERLIPEETIRQLTPPELGLLILAAFFHDIGMAPSEEEVVTWFQFWDTNDSTEPQPGPANEFYIFAKSHPDRLSQIENLKRSGALHQANLMQEYLIADYIRHTHARRAREIIAEDWSGKIRYRDTDLTVELAELCASHNNDPASVLDLPPAVLCGPGIYARMPFLGIVLRLADLLDFDAKRTPMVLLAHLGVRHPVSLSEWAKHRSVEAWDIDPNRIAFRASCEHPAIEAGIRGFCDYIDRELASCASVLRHYEQRVSIPLPEHYKIRLPTSTDRSQITARRNVHGEPRYRYRDTRFSLSQAQVIDLLMGTVLYGDPAAALRELIQNSLDACLTRQAMEANWGNLYLPQLTIEIQRCQDGDRLIVEDNGIGMDQHILDNYYTQIGASFYRSNEFYRIRAEHGLKFQPISRFGIGILACFMISDGIEVNTRRLIGPHDSSKPLRVMIESRDSIFWITDGSRQQPGTATRLFLRPGHPWSRMDEAQQIEAIKKLVPNPPFPLQIRCGQEQTSHEGSDFRDPPILTNAVSHDDPENLFDDNENHLRSLAVNLTEFGNGIAGYAKVWVLQERHLPVAHKELFSRHVHIDEDNFGAHLVTELTAEINAVERRSDSLEVTESGIETSPGYSIEKGSTAHLSVHGIHVPVTLFASTWARRYSNSDDAMIFPFPCELHVDVTGERDLQLNVARTEIVRDQQWFDFVETVALAIIQGIRKQVTQDYWTELTSVWRKVLQHAHHQTTTNFQLSNSRVMTVSTFLRALERAESDG